MSPDPLRPHAATMPGVEFLDAAICPAGTDLIPVSPVEPPPIGRGFTVADIACRYRVGEDKVRGWIRRRELEAINTASNLCGKPRWVITPEALVDFERRRAAATPTKPPRRRRPQSTVDYYP